MSCDPGGLFLAVDLRGWTSNLLTHSLSNQGPSGSNYSKPHCSDRRIDLPLALLIHGSGEVSGLSIFQGH